MQKEEKKRQFSQSSSGGESADDFDNDADFIDDSSMYEKKLNILHIPHIILWKMMNQNCLKLQENVTLVGQEALHFLLETQKKFI